MGSTSYSGSHQAYHSCQGHQDCTHLSFNGLLNLILSIHHFSLSQHSDKGRPKINNNNNNSFPSHKTGTSRHREDSHLYWSHQALVLHPRPLHRAPGANHHHLLPHKAQKVSRSLNLVQKVYHHLSHTVRDQDKMADRTTHSGS